MSRVIKNRTAISGGQFFLDYTSVSITANTNNLAITDIQNFVIIEVTTTGNFNVTGIVPADVSVGWLLKLFNAGINNITLKNNDANSLAPNRFAIGADKLIQPGEGYELTYRPSVQRWGSTGSNI